jgi:hypothetical protein
MAVFVIINQFRHIVYLLTVQSNIVRAFPANQPKKKKNLSDVICMVQRYLGRTSGQDFSTIAQVAPWVIPPMSVVAFPFVGLLMDKLGLIKTHIAVVAFQIVFGVLAAIPVLNVQYATFIAVGFARQSLLTPFLALVAMMCVSARPTSEIR